MLTKKQIQLIEYGLLLLLDHKTGSEDITFEQAESLAEEINEVLLAVKAMQE